MDRDLREAERSGDGVRILRERLRAGDLTQEHIDLAARLGHPHAREMMPEVDVVQREDELLSEDMFWVIGEHLGYPTLVSVAVEWAERALPRWEALMPGDATARNAIAAAREWTECPCPEHADKASEAAFLATGAVDNAPVGPAIYGSTAAYNVAWLVEALENQDLAAALGFVRDVAKFASASVDLGVADFEWQRLRLAEYVLGLVDLENRGCRDE